MRPLLLAFLSCSLFLGCGGDEGTSPEPAAGGSGGSVSGGSGGAVAGQGGAGQAGEGQGGAGQAGSAGSGGDAGKGGEAGAGEAGEAGASGASGQAGAAGEAGAGGAAGAAGQAPSFTEVRAKVFASCGGFGPMSCHGKSPYQGDLDLTSDTVYQSLVNVTSPLDGSLIRVVPGKPEESFLLRKYINDLPSDGSLGEPMPKGEAIQWSMPPQENIDLLRGWILAGAKDD